MQDRTYADLKELIQALSGVSSFTPSEDANIVNFVNRRASQAYNMSPSWSRYVVAGEERAVASIELKNFQDQSVPNDIFIKIGTSDTALGRDDGSDVFISHLNSQKGFTRKSNLWYFFSGSFYTLNPITGVVTFSADGGIDYYQQKSTDTEVYSSPADVKEWVHTGGSAGAANTPANIQVNSVSKIPYNSLLFPIIDSSKPVGTLTPIGEFVRVHRKRSFLNNSSLEYDFYVDNDGANILNIVNNEDVNSFVTYKKELTTFNENSTDIPSEFFHYLAHSSYADFLRMDGQNAKALQEEEIAKGYINAQLEQIDIRNNNNSLNHKFSTYVNRQSR
tara:strand:+ start:97 stop:1098 length:1002 start_codon:yes stop_codon:yes gene_type:complete